MAQVRFHNSLISVNEGRFTVEGSEGVFQTYREAKREEQRIQEAQRQASVMTYWTVADLAEFTQLAAEMDIVYCEHCQVIPVHVDEKYCLACTADLVDDLAKRVVEQAQLDKGLY